MSAKLGVYTQGAVALLFRADQAIWTQALAGLEITCIASVSVGLRSKERPRNEPERHFARVKLGREPN